MKTIKLRIVKREKKIRRTMFSLTVAQFVQPIAGIYYSCEQPLILTFIVTYLLIIKIASTHLNYNYCLLYEQFEKLTSL